MGKVLLPKGFDPKVVKRWYVVANQAEALVYEGNPNGWFHFLKRMSNPRGKLRESQLVSDHAGRSFSGSRSGARHGFEPRTSAHEVVASRFARQIAQMLTKAVQSGECSDLVVMAEPHFLGLMNKALPKGVKAVLRRELPREWVQGSDRDLKVYLREKLG